MPAWWQPQYLVAAMVYVVAQKYAYLVAATAYFWVVAASGGNHGTLDKKKVHLFCGTQPWFFVRPATPGQVTSGMAAIDAHTFFLLRPNNLAPRPEPSGRG